MKYPKGEIVWVFYYTTKGELRFIMTSKQARDFYFLYEVVDGEFKKLGKSNNPTKLEEKFNLKENLSV